MNVTVSHIRSALQECYPPREAANLSRIVCCEMFVTSCEPQSQGHPERLQEEAQFELRFS